MPEESNPQDIASDPNKSVADNKQDKKQGFVTRSNADGKSVMRVKIYAPFKVYYDEDAESISAENDTGPFDILPRHKNFMTLLSPCDIVVRRTGADDFTIKITRAIMHVKADQVTVFLDV